MAQHRPTWNPAVGKKNNGNISFQISAKDQLGQTKIKYRQVGQSSKTEMAQRNLVEELEERELEYLSEKNKMIAMIENEEKKVNVPMLKNYAENLDTSTKYNDDDIEFSNTNDNDGFSESSSEEGDDDDNDDDDDDDELELQRELEKIKAERAAAAKKKEEEDRKLAAEMDLASAVKGNPLLNLDSSSTETKVKRRWNDDVVFKNQAKSEPELKKRFINDTIRNDFHRSFLKKYIQ